MLRIITLNLNGIRAAVYKAERFSDHAPLTIDYELRVP